MMRYAKGAFLLMLTALPLMYGCQPKLPDIYWPLPPSQPRIKFVMNITSTKDFSSVSVKDVLLGAEPGFAAFVKPNGIHADNLGRIFITDTGAGTVQILDMEEKKSRMLTVSGRSTFVKPVDVVTDADGRIYVSDTASNFIFVFDSEYKYVTVIGQEGDFKRPVGLAVDNKRHRLYVVDTHLHQVIIFDLKTFKRIGVFGERGRAKGSFNYPQRIAVDSNGNVYVVDTMNGRVQIFDPEGEFLRAFGRLGDSPGNFARPKGIAIDSEGHIYVVDAAFNNIQIFNEEGRVLMAFGGFGEGRGSMILPSDISIDSEDRIYVTDQWNARLSMFEYMGEKYYARQGGKKKQ